MGSKHTKIHSTDVRLGINDNKFALAHAVPNYGIYVFF